MATTQGMFHRGQTVCRPSDWQDVVLFFLLNYGLHAVTVLTEPGSKPIACALASLTAVLMPAVGIARAVDEIGRFAVKGYTDLDVALRAGALCMLAPAYPSNEYPKVSVVDSMESPAAAAEISHSHGGQGASPDTSDQSPPEPIEDYSEVLTGVFVPISSYLTKVQGEFPMDIKKPGLRARGEDPEAKDITYSSPLDYCMIEVPRHFKVSQFLRPAKVHTRFERIKDWCKKATVLTKSRAQSTPITATTIASGSTSGGEPAMASPQDGDDRSELDATPVRLASNYNVVKSIAAIIQILYGSFELYQVGKQQIDEHGYVSYQLTVIPYVLMSLANLLAGMTGPRYSSRFLVHYGGIKRKEPGDTQNTEGDGTDKNFARGWWNKRDREEVEERTRGAVGLVYGNFLEDSAARISIQKLPQFRQEGIIEKTWQNIKQLIPARLRNKGKGNPSWGAVAWLLSLAFLAGPYVIIYLLTQFIPVESTISERSWIMSWFVLGQVGSVLLSIVVELDKFRRFAVRYPLRAFGVTALVTVLLSVSTMGGFVVVAKMILETETCQVL